MAAVKLGFYTAHTAYTREALDTAQVLADTPVFSDYEELASLYPNCKIVHLQRDLNTWLPSIKRLLSAMKDNLLSDKGGFNDTIKRCYLNTFPNFIEHFDEPNYWYEIAINHQKAVEAFASRNKLPYLCFSLSQQDAKAKFADFFDVPVHQVDFPHVNIGGKVTAWKWLKDSRKVPSTRAGKADRDTALYLSECNPAAN
ncbi:sulfotransferase [Pseudoalteromonas sp. T1lg65]|uniref:sulfotransferase n=1 Tax=Pseudoalteromonas sp. T1lg65 TaxID=2077101 RepID=UPI003F7A427E